MPGILVVEDDENLNRGIAFSLKKSGYEVFSAESVKKAKRIASDNNVDVTICDVNLPDGNGLEFIRWMRCNYNTYIICLTALDQEMDQVMGYEAGADDYITKPFSLSVLLLKIEAHFRRRQEKTEAGKMISGDIVFIAGEMKVLSAAEMCFYFQKKYRKTKRLCNIIICPCFISHDLIHLLVQCCKANNVCIIIASHPPYKFQSIPIRKIHITNGNIHIMITCNSFRFFH